MKKLFHLFTFISCLLITGCSTDLYDYEELNNRMDGFDQRLATLEDWCKETNTNINSLKALVESLLTHDMITSVTPIVNNNVVIGYTITFLNADPITIYHGQDGKDGADGKDGQDGEDGKDGADGQDGKDGLDGYTPIIGVKQDTDGVYYWTLDGEWLTDAQGNKVRAQGEKGADGEDGKDGQDGEDGKDGTDGEDGKDGADGAAGKDGVTPQLKIEDNYWYLSYDNGQTWTKLGKAVGEDGKDGQDGADGEDGKDGADGADGKDGVDGKDGDSFFQSVDTSDPNFVVFTLSDGTQIKIPTWTAFAALQTQCNQMNTNLSSLQTIVSALQDKDYVTSVTPLMQDGVEVGYTIMFSKSGAVVIYHGKDGQDGEDGKDGVNGEDGKDGQDGANGADGKDGYSPVIGVKQDTDGVYYWTVDGEWLLDANNNKVKVQGEDGKDGTDGEDGKDGQDGTDGSNGADGTDGKDGADGITPQLKIENGYWYVSYDNGTTWTKMSDEYAVSGNDVFKKITISEGNIIFTLTDDSEVIIPVYQEIGITFDMTDNVSGIAANEVIYVPYTLTNATEKTKVTVSSDGHYAAEVVATSYDKGEIVITAPAMYVDGHVNVHIDSGNGYASFHVINFYHQEMTFSKGLEYNVKPEGEVIAVPLTTNFDYTVSIPDAAKSWISLAESRAIATRNETLTFTFAANENLKSSRSASVGIIPTNAKEPLYYIRFNQASANFSIDKSRFAASAEGGEFTANVTSTLGLKATSEVDWVVPTIVQNATTTTKYTLTLKVATNSTGAYRTGYVNLYATDGTLLGKVEVAQLSLDNDEMKVMILEIAAGPANEYTTVLPLDGTVDCIVDWGDGSPIESVNKKLPKHTYAQESKNYIVRITGTVTKLSSNSISATYKNSFYAIKQWGNTGLVSMQYAFKGCNNLRTVVADETEAFVNVTDFSECFQGCIRLETLFPNLFAYAFSATTFKYAFSGCTNLKEVPASLFSNCAKVTDMTSVFSSTGLTAEGVPEELFSSCKEVTNFSNVFSNCESLKTVPAGLFAKNTKVTTFVSAFFGTSLEEIPETLFVNCSKVMSFASTFSNTKIEKVPAGLFTHCPLVNSFSKTFYSCLKLVSVPVGLFDNNRQVINFSECFYSYSSSPYQHIEGESPYTIINGVKYHLYERINNPTEFITPTSYRATFQAQNLLTDYEQIPDDWK